MRPIFDRLCALCGLAAFAPMFCIVALAILFEDRGEVFFVQERLGRGMRPFRVYKFRSMRGGKVTRVGGWIRTTGLDEVLQFVHVLQGSMAMVGPRPMTRDDLARLGWLNPAMGRWRCKPGVTGLAQLFAGKGCRVSRFLDEWYVRHSSLRLDLTVMALSFLVNCVGKYRVRRLLSQWRGWRRKLRRARGPHRGTSVPWGQKLSLP